MIEVILLNKQFRRRGKGEWNAGYYKYYRFK